MHISCQTYLPTPSSGGSSSSNSRKTLRAMAERSEEAHHVAEFHTGRGDWRWSLADQVSIGDTRTTWVVKRSLTSPFFLFSFFLSFLKKRGSICDEQTEDEHHWACMSSVLTQNPPALQFRSNDNKCNKRPVWYARPRGATTAIYSASHSPVRRTQ